MGDLPPEWAIEKAHAAIAKYRDDAYIDIVSLPTAKENIQCYPGFRAFAEYIAAHEEAPVDPLLLEAREIVAQWYDANPDKVYQSNRPELIRSGSYDKTEVEQALAALRRGMELARKATPDA